jgi:Ca2+-binding EF-hand superfamily protein
MGQGKGMGQGMRLGIGKGMPEEGGMMRGFNDSDGDGRVSREEFTGRTAAWFTMMDRDGDGSVTEADFGR